MSTITAPPAARAGATGADRSTVEAKVVEGEAVVEVVTGTTDQQVGEPASTLALAVDVVRAEPSVSGARLADELTRRGRPVSVRSGQRWRARAVDVLTG